MQWTDQGLADLDPASLDTSDVVITGVAVDRIEILESGRVRYWYADDGQGLTEGEIGVQMAPSAVWDEPGNVNVSGEAYFVFAAKLTSTQTTGLLAAAHVDEVFRLWL